MSIPAPSTSRTSDVRRRTVLPQTLRALQLSSAQSGAHDLELPSDEYLDKMEEELNRAVDSQVGVLVDGMGDLVRMADIEGKDHFRVAQETFQAEIRSESLIRAAHSLLSLSHTLKLLHLFADSHSPALARESIAGELRKKIRVSEAEVERLVGRAEGREEGVAEEKVEL